MSFETERAPAREAYSISLHTTDKMMALEMMRYHSPRCLPGPSLAWRLSPPAFAVCDAFDEFLGFPSLLGVMPLDVDDAIGEELAWFTDMASSLRYLCARSAASG